MKGEDLTLFKTDYLANSHAFVLEATHTILLKKITSQIKFAEQKSALLQNNKLRKKNSAFCSVTLYHPTTASPKEHLYEQLASNPAFTERNMQKANPHILNSCSGQNSLYVVFGLSTF